VLLVEDVREVAFEAASNVGEALVEEVVNAWGLGSRVVAV
jgi:hypothetical protein